MWPGVACGSVLMTLLVGTDLRRAKAITPSEIASLIDLPPAKIHCAELAVRALRDAIHNAQHLPHLPTAEAAHHHTP